MDEKTREGLVKLADAILVGASRTRKAEKAWMRCKGGRIVAACALSCAYITTVENPSCDPDVLVVYRELKRGIGIDLDLVKVPDPAENTKRPWAGYSYAIGSIIQELNDDHRWKRERIAEWIRSLAVDTQDKGVESE